MTKLEKPIRRELRIGDTDYTITMAPDSLKVVQKGHRKGIELRWTDIIGGDASLAAALRASTQE